MDSVLKKSVLLCLMSVIVLFDVSAREVTDMIGRKVKLPEKVEKVFGLSNDMMVYVYTLNPEKLLGWNFPLADGAKPFLTSDAIELPVLGSAPGKSINEETILRLKPDLILCSDEDAFVNPDELQARLNIPVVKVKVDLESTPEVYRIVGYCMYEDERAEKLAQYAEKALAEMNEKKSKMPAEAHKSIYYAEGVEGLQTNESGSLHTQVLDFLNIKNVANTGNVMANYVTVSFEQIIAWNPEVILVTMSRKADVFKKIKEDRRWNTLSAVKNGLVYRTPGYPFNWFDRPQIGRAHV